MLGWQTSYSAVQTSLCWTILMTQVKHLLGPQQDWGLDNIADDIKNVRFATITDNATLKFDVDYLYTEINKAEDPLGLYSSEEWW